MRAPAGAVAVVFDDVSVERQGRAVLEHISLRLRAGAFVGIVWPNGAGKTTLLRAMLGLVPITSGRIEVFGRPPGAGRPDLGYVPQRHQLASRFPATVREVVAMARLDPRGVLGRVRREDREATGRALALVGIEALADRLVGQLSGGEQRRVMLAQALCASRRLLVLDEPTIGLDLPAEQSFYALLGALRRELGLTILAVSHDLLALAAAADELVCINRTLHVHGSPEDVMHSHALLDAYRCEFDFVAGEVARRARPGSA